MKSSLSTSMTVVNVAPGLPCSSIRSGNIMAILNLLLLLCLFPINEATAEKPNVLLLLVDDLGIGDVGCFGNNTIRTPNIDRLAREGVKLTQHVAAASLCSPSRSAFLTGRYPIRTGKWHLGVNCESRNDFCHHPLNHGFDYFYGTPFTLVNDCEVSRPSELHVAFKRTLWFYAQIFAITLLTLGAANLWHVINVPWKIIFAFTLFGTVFFMYWYAAYAFQIYWNCIWMENFEIVEQPMDLEKKAGQLVREAKSFINRNKDGPFLLFVSFLHVHTPHYTTKNMIGRSKHDLYGDNVEEVDWMIGEILDAIDEEGLVNDTLTYFTSDHGGYLEGMTGSPHLKGSNGIYRGGKGMGGLEGGIRVPGILRWPSVIPANTAIDKPTSLMDIFPTVTKLGGGVLPQDRIIDGKDLIPLVQGLIPDSEHKFMFHYCDEYLHAVRWQQTTSDTIWKVHYFSPKFSPGEGACYWSKLCPCSGDNVIYHSPPLLFNLSNDPSENNPLPSDLPLYNEVLQTIEQAVAHHNSTLYPVPQQLYGINNLWNPRLQPCCGTFPLCWCNKNKTN
ncbi:arylsulfatase H-like isoform X2 [Pseudophryne corroboree]|uniref:arylsulfatase H-like isoform X2 n=1 Tax=Pseudophryne corroboree TaxID=495146 RepID=UPI003081757A